MKKTCLILALLLSSAALKAEVYDTLRFSLRLGLGMSPEAASSAYRNIPFIGDAYVSGPDNTVSSVYGDYRGAIRTTGAIYFEGQAELNKTINGSLVLGFTPLWNSRYSPKTGEKTGSDSGLALCIMPKIHVNYLNRKRLNLYCSFALGTNIYLGFDKLASSGDKIRPSIQYSPFGIELKFEKWGLFGEIGIGSLYCGGSFGAVYRF